MARTSHQQLLAMSVYAWPSVTSEPHEPNTSEHPYAPDVIPVGAQLPAGVVRFVHESFKDRLPPTFHEVHKPGPPVTVVELVTTDWLLSSPGFTLVQIAPGHYLPQSLDLYLTMTCADTATDSQADLINADVSIGLDEPHWGITVLSSTLLGRDKRGRPEVVDETTIALALRSLTDRMVFCREHVWHVDSPTWQPEPIAAQDRILKRIRQRMQPNWVERQQLIRHAASVVEDAREHRRSTTLAVARALHVSERQADELIREAKDVGCLRDT